MGRGAAEAGALDGLTGIGLVNPDDGKLLLGVTGGPGGTIGVSNSDILGKSSLGNSIGACLN